MTKKKMSKGAKIVLISIAAFVVGTWLIKFLFSIIPDKDNTVKTESSTSEEETSSTAMTSVPVSEDDISAIVSQMVESELAKQAAEATSTTQTTATTQVTEASTAVATVVATSEKTSPEVEKESASGTELSVIAHHVSTDYTLPTWDDQYKAAFYHLYMYENSRDLTLTINSSITNISVATSYINEDKRMSEFSDFTDISFTTTEDGITSISYSIQDNPNGCGFPKLSEKEIGFCGVFRIELGDTVVYTAISY